MLSDEEVADLAEDIKARGLIHPIVVDGDVLIDGRDRLRVRELAGIEPTFREFPWSGVSDAKEEAITAYIVGENIRRRHLNAGQRAVLYAIAYPDPTPGKRTNLLKISIGHDVDRACRAIVKWCAECVEDILAGIQVFAKAFEEADKRRTKAAVVVEQMKRLVNEAPDLYGVRSRRPQRPSPRLMHESKRKREAPRSSGYGLS